jgi:uncharacterized membrane protein YdjX (TVP38/TMEM64 family)
VTDVKRRLVVLILLILAAAAVWLSPLREHLTREDIRLAVESVRGAWYAPLLLIGLYAIGCVFAVPASLFIVAAGALWGWLLGGAFAMIGGVLGAMASFSAGRYLGATRNVDERLRNAKFRTLLIARLLPIFPFAVLNYGAGVARVDSRAFFFSTLVGLIPSNFVFAWSADEIFNGTLSGGDVLLRLFVVAGVCIVAVVIPSVATRRRVSRHV